MIANCPKCGVKVQIPPGSADKAFKCSRCSAVFKVATPPSVASAPPSAANAPSAIEAEPPPLPPKKKPDRSKNSEETATRFKMQPLDSLALSVGSISLLLGWFPLFGAVISGPGFLIGLVASLRNAGNTKAVRRLVIAATLASLGAAAFSIIVPIGFYLYYIGAFDTEASIKYADATSEAIDCGNATVLVRAARRSRKPLVNQGQEAEQPRGHLIAVRIRVENRSKDELLVYQSWGTDVNFGPKKLEARMETTDGNALKLIGGVGGEIPLAADDSFKSLKPGEVLEDTLIFEDPSGGVTSDYRLRLPAAHLGYKGEIGFKIPQSFVKDAQQGKTERNQD